MKTLLTYLCVTALLTCSSFADLIGLEWDRVTDGAPVEYLIKARLFGTTEWKVVAKTPVTANPKEKATIELAAGRWEIAVASRNASKESGLSNIVDTGAAAPGAPTNVKITVLVEVVVP